MTRPPRKFQTKWEEECGIKPIEMVPDPSDPSSMMIIRAVCSFCQVFGREERTNGELDEDSQPSSDTKGRKRKRTQNIKYFTEPWRIDQMKRHISQAHPKKSNEFASASLTERRSFFGNLPSQETNNCDSNNQLKPSQNIDELQNIGTTTLLLKQPVIDLVKIDTASYRNIRETKLFTCISNQDQTIITISNNAVYEYLRNGLAYQLSMDQISGMLHCAPNLLGLTEEKLSASVLTQLCQFQIAQAINTIRHALNTAWAFSLVFVPCKTAFHECVDMRLRFLRGARLYDVHTLTFQKPFLKEDVVKVLDGLCSQWREKLIGLVNIAIDDEGPATNEEVLYGVASTAKIRAYSNLFHVSNHNFSIFLIIKEYIDDLQSGRFKDDLKTVAHKLTNQNISSIGFSGFDESNWSCVCNTFRLLVKHIDQVKQFSTNASVWIGVLIIHQFITMLNDVALDQLRYVRANLMKLTNIEDDLSDQAETIDILTKYGFSLSWNRFGKFINEFTKECSIDPDFLHSLGSVTIRLVHRLKNLEQHIPKVGSITTAPVFTPHQIGKIDREMFENNLLKPQLTRLQKSHQANYVQLLKIEFEDFHEKYNTNASFKECVCNTKEASSFFDAWQPFQSSHAKLVEFFGGLATVCYDTHMEHSIIGKLEVSFPYTESPLSIFDVYLHAIQYPQLHALDIDRSTN